jgi:hypothetical protein
MIRSHITHKEEYHGILIDYKGDQLRYDAHIMHRNETFWICGIKREHYIWLSGKEKSEVRMMIENHFSEMYPNLKQILK